MDKLTIEQIVHLTDCPYCRQAVDNPCIKRGYHTFTDPDLHPSRARKAFDVFFDIQICSECEGKLTKQQRRIMTTSNQVIHAVCAENARV